MTATPEQINALAGELPEPEPDLNIPFFMTPEYQAAEAAAKAAKAHAMQRNADHRQDRARVDGLTLLWGLSLIALGLAVMM